MRGVPRLFRSHPGYAAASTGVLAVAVGANLLVFTIVNALWIRPLPFPEPNRVVTIPRVRAVSIDQPAFRIFEGGIAGQVDTTDTAEGLTPRIAFAAAGPLETLGVTPGYFHVLRLPIRGRDFQPADDSDGVEPVGIISDRVWADAFDRRTDVVGAVVSATPIPIRVIGVAPANFHGARRGEEADLWVPISVVRRLAPSEWAGHALPLLPLARLGPGQTLATVTRRFDALAPGVLRAFQTTVTPLPDVFGTPASATSVIDERDSLSIVSGLALVVLLGGCATLAALVLMHYERRRTELAVRMSLGASRRRLMGEIARDLSVIGLAGGGAGIALAAMGLRVMPALRLPGGIDLGRLTLAIDGRAYVVALAAAFVTLAGAGLVPLLRATRPHLAAELLARTTLRGSLALRQGLLVLQTCAAVVVLVAAGLFVKTVLIASTRAAGFDVDRTVFISVQQGSAYRETSNDPSATIAARGTRLTTRLLQVPGVMDVAEGIPPISEEATRIAAPLRTVRTGREERRLSVGLYSGSPNLLSTLSVPILRGRALTAADGTGRPRPAVLTESLARTLWPGGDALGHELAIPEARGGPYLVVGIARDFAFGSLSHPAAGVVVSAGRGMDAIVSSFVVRTSDPQDVAKQVTRTIRGEAVHATLATDVIARDLGRQRLGAWFFSLFGAVALILGGGGVFGLVAYLAESQRREFGVRLALGADGRRLVRDGLMAALTPVSIGAGAGLLVGAALSRVFQSLLVGVSALDPATYAMVAIAMLACATLAGLSAAWRLRKMTPADALRAD
jgi:predicted permease